MLPSVEVVVVLVDVPVSVRFLFLLCRLGPPFPLTVNVDSTTISSNASPNAAVNTRQIHTSETENTEVIYCNIIRDETYPNISEKHNSALESYENMSFYACKCKI